MEIEQRVRDVVAGLGVDYEFIACDPDLADTTAFCEHYGYSLDESANTILVASKRPPGRHAACVVLADTRLDVNKRVRSLLEVRKLSFASPDLTAEVTGMAIGGVTVFALPTDLPLYVDSRVMARDWVIVGGGSRSLKIKVPPAALEGVGGVTIEGLANPIDP